MNLTTTGCIRASCTSPMVHGARVHPSPYFSSFTFFSITGWLA